jgi:predicted nucleic acid-binding protein
VITLDTSAIYAYLNRFDVNHQAVSRTLHNEAGPLVVPVSILSEIAYLLERHGQNPLRAFLGDIEREEYLLDCGAGDLQRIGELIRRYDDLPLGFADAAVIACAERRGRRVLTYDRRHFSVVSREGSIILAGVD